MLIGTDCIGSCKPNYHTITTRTRTALTKIRMTISYYCCNKNGNMLIDSTFQSTSTNNTFVCSLIFFCHIVLLCPSNRLICIAIGCVIVSMFASRAVDRGFEPRSGQRKYYKIGICCFSAKHAALIIRRKSKDWLSRNQDNVSE